MVTRVFAIRIVQYICFLNTKFQASSHLLWLYSPVSVGAGRKPRRPVSHNEAHFTDRGPRRHAPPSLLHCRALTIPGVHHYHHAVEGVGPESDHGHDCGPGGGGDGPPHCLVAIRACDFAHILEYTCKDTSCLNRFV